MTAAPHLHPVDHVIDLLRDAGCNPKASRPGQWNAKCPNQAGHRNGDRNPSLSVGTGPDGKALLHCQTGCKLPDVAQALGIGVHDLFPERPRSTIGAGKRITATYDYYDAEGVLEFQVVRYHPKTFRQRRPLPDGSWEWSIASIPERPLYMLPQVRRAIELGQRVWMTEGEKDAEALQWAVEGVTTCNSGGAEGWRDEYARQLTGAKRITLVQDADAAGLKHVRRFARELLAAGFGDIDVVAPPPPFKDAAEALGAGRTIEQFVHVWDNSESADWLHDGTPEAPSEPVETPDGTEVATDDVADDDWATIELGELAEAMLAGHYEPIMPTALAVTGGLPLFYPGRINSLFGESGGGKTWVALAAVAEVVRSGERVLFVDYEDNPQGIVERLVLLGLVVADIALVDYRNPTTGIGRGSEVVEGRYGLVVIDSTGEAMAAGSVDPNSDGEVATWFTIAKRYARLDGGPPVVVLDHVPKDRDAPSAYAIGSQRKRAALNGAAYRIDTIKEPAKGRSGKLKATVAKDRLGNRPKGSVAAEIDVVSNDAGVRIELHVSDAQAAAEAGEKFRPTVLMERVSRFLELRPIPTSQRGVEGGVTGKGAGIRMALECLVEEGYAKAVPGGFESVAPYREPVDNSKCVPASQARPTASRDAAEEARPPRPRDSLHGDAGRASEGRDTPEGSEVRPPVDNYEEELF